MNSIFDDEHNLMEETLESPVSNKMMLIVVGIGLVSYGVIFGVGWSIHVIVEGVWHSG